VLYSAVPHGAGGNDSPLTVDRTTGQLSLRRSLDYEHDHTHVILVAAHDAGPASITAYARVIVHVTDVNDHAPNIRVHTTANTDDDVTIWEDCDAWVDENGPPGVVVAQVSVVDVDAGDNGKTDCRLKLMNNSTSSTSGNDFILQLVHSGVYTVSTASALDRESADVHRLWVVCVDGGLPVPLDSKAALTVCVVDWNDNAPEFHSADYSASVAEDAPVGTVVLRVTATDRDLRQNGEVYYHIRPTVNDDNDDDDDDGIVSKLLSIDSRDGRIATTASLDYESHARLNFFVVASDRGRPRLSTVVPVTISIRDVNDEGPRFTQAAYEFEAYENEPAGTEVGVVSVQDGDGPPYDRFQLYVLNAAAVRDTPALADTPVDDAFSVDVRTGRVLTLIPLDRELRSVYRLMLVARDDHPPHFTATANVTVRVLDRNDNSPMIAAADASRHLVGVLAFNVSAQSTPGHQVY